jgi:D-aminoacyl-tRNA deacylase
VVSRHSGETGPLLTAHHTGNFGPAEFGGEPGRFARAAPGAHRAAVAALAEHAPPGYEVGVECTHHGPTAVDVPSLFVELGSGPDQWDDPAGAEAVARATLDLRGVDPDGDRAVVGLGGGHYAPRHERVIRETDWGVGHVGADWALDAMGDPSANAAVLDRAFERSGTGLALIEGDRPGLVAAVESLGRRAVGERWLRETDGVALGLVDRLESRLVPVADGLRFGAPATDLGGDATPAIRTLPDDLLGAAAGVDPGATREAVAGRTAAFETDHGGSRPAGRAAFADGEAYGALVDALAALLREKYDAVERHDGTVVARRERFDPELARTLGVSEGPAFGRLAAGEPVEVNGRTIPPGEVRSETVDRFPV